jgi:hypothetical protein
MRSRIVLCAALGALTLASRAEAFCGFFVGKADAKLFNKSSQVALVRDGNRTVMTLANDYEGPLSEFALVVPVPSVLTREQIHVGNPKLLERLDAYSSPRLVEYTDPDPCERRYALKEKAARVAMPMAAAGQMARDAASALGVRVEASYTVGEYDIVLLSATQSAGLEIWLRASGYRIPPRAARALEPYIKQDMKFFVAKVNLKEQKASGFQALRPIQIAYESPKFMLPIRLGMANAHGAQDLVVYTITRTGRVESSNYQTVKIPSDVEVPEFVKDRFGDFYKATFENAWKEQGQRAILTEYVWNMSWCDPCAAPPLDASELRELGVFWLDDVQLPGSQPWRRAAPIPGAIVLTRLHVRYDAEHFPEDLMFQETGDQQQFQGRYVMRHPFRGELSCPEADEYRRSVAERRRREAETLARLTGWPMDTIREGLGPDPVAPSAAWWKRIWQQ